jgi:hypothetical protein
VLWKSINKTTKEGNRGRVSFEQALVLRRAKELAESAEVREK